MFGNSLQEMVHMSANIWQLLWYCSAQFGLQLSLFLASLIIIIMKH